MAYIGRIPNVGNYFTLDAITTSATDTFNLLKGGVAYVPETAYHLIVSLNGVIQAPITAYTVSGSTIVFASSLASTDSIDFITVLGDTLAIGTPSDATVGAAQIAATLDLSSKTVTLPAASVTAHVTSYDDNKLQSNIALLGFKTAVNGSLAKYNLVDQIVDEYTDATGVDAAASTNEILLSGVYSGNSTSSLSGGTLNSYSGYSSRTFLADGNLVVTGSGTVDILLVGGGGQGGFDSEGDAGGGGAGGFRVITGHTLSAGTHAIQVGDGGAAGDSQNNGQDTVALTYTATGGGSGSRSATYNGVAGGSGGGGGGESNTTAGAGNTPSTSPAQGFAGGIGDNTSGSPRSGGGGGGASEVGEGAVPSNGGDGGDGVANNYRTGSNVTYAGGGGGGSKTTRGVGGAGGGGDGASTGSSGMTGGSANTGGGGGGGDGGSVGGTGIVVVRFATGQFGGAVYNDLTLQSTDTTASTEADNADMVMLMENAAGTATLNTDIKGYISRDSGSTFTQGTLVDEGTWGTNKKNLAFHDLNISGQPSGTDMCYKITTHNQSASKDTRVHATSIGWK